MAQASKGSALFFLPELTEVRRGRAESGKILRPAAQEVLSLQSRHLKNGM
jgi:hypothetical protein